MVRPTAKAADLYGVPQTSRMDDYLDETARLRWTSQEMMVLWVWASSKTVPELMIMLPRRNDLSIRRMLDYLSS